MSVKEDSDWGKRTRHSISTIESDWKGAVVDIKERKKERLQSIVLKNKTNNVMVSLELIG